MNHWMPPMLAGLCRRSLQHKLTIRCATQPVQVEFGLYLLVPSYSFPVFLSIHEASLQNAVPEGVKGPAALLHSVWSLDCQMAD